MNPQMIGLIATAIPMVFKLVQKHLEIKEKEVENARLTDGETKALALRGRKIYVLDTKTGKKREAYLCE